jgi:hypothetical protein
VLAAQLVTRGGLLDGADGAAGGDGDLARRIPVPAFTAGGRPNAG